MNPYASLPDSAFWRKGVVDCFPSFEGVYKKKFILRDRDKIATAGSCFAQHISRHLKQNGFDILDKEPAPPNIAPDAYWKHGYGQYSARFGNIYSVHQLLQLAMEAFGDVSIELPIWRRDGRYYDALRPGVEIDGYSSHEQVVEERLRHLESVRALFLDLDVLVFTLGLTEYWYDTVLNAVLPIAPEVIAGDFEPGRHEFRNANVLEVVSVFNEFQKYIQEKRDGTIFRCILTVSPVPLTATYANRHVIVSTSASKSILRAAAAHLQDSQGQIDYFPSYEIVTHPCRRSSGFEENMRTVNPEAVADVMSVFFGQHKPNSARNDGEYPNQDIDLYVNCEEERLEAVLDD